MNYFQELFIKKQTLFSIIGIIYIVLAIPLGLIQLGKSGGVGLGGVYTLGSTIIVFIAYSIDRFIAQIIKPKILSTIELVALILLLLIISMI